MSKGPTATRFATLLQRFFCEYLMNQRNVSPRTVAAYRDTFRLLLNYIHSHVGIAPSEIELEHLTADRISAFLCYLEDQRKNSVRTRNARLAAVRSFLHYSAALVPESLSVIQRALGVPQKRYNRGIVHSLTREQISVLLDSPDDTCWSGRRDRALLRTLYNTGARVSEIINVRIKDVNLDRTPFITIHGKGRKERTIPLWRSTARLLRHWLREIVNEQEYPLFPDARGNPLSRSGVQYRLKVAVDRSAQSCPSLNRRNVSPHTIRHSTAMHLLQSGTDLSAIALWLGHENPTTTHMYMEADLAMKEKALNGLPQPTARSTSRYRPSDKLIKFLEAL
jgi:integrase/recombinase XerD